MRSTPSPSFPRFLRSSSPSLCPSPLPPHSPCPVDQHWYRRAGVEALTWPPNASVSPALSLQLHCLAEPALLKALVQQALPLPPSGPSHSTPQQAGTVRSLCLMLQALAGVSALCQKALIFTGGPADFVQRLWMSHLKACLPTDAPRSMKQVAALCPEVTDPRLTWLHVWV